VPGFFGPPLAATRGQHAQLPVTKLRGGGGGTGVNGGVAALSFAIRYVCVYKIEEIQMSFKKWHTKNKTTKRTILGNKRNAKSLVKISQFLRLNIK